MRVTSLQVVENTTRHLGYVMIQIAQNIHPPSHQSEMDPVFTIPEVVRHRKKKSARCAAYRKLLQMVITYLKIVGDAGAP
jgi:hypothetical protein